MVDHSEEHYEEFEKPREIKYDLIFLSNKFLYFWLMKKAGIVGHYNLNVVKEILDCFQS